jgi:hypothetical protein
MSMLTNRADGGGIRGMSGLLILKEIMARIQYQRNLDSMPFPYDYFDLMGGSGTGGFVAILITPCCCLIILFFFRRILVLMLGRLRMSIDDAIKYYDFLTRKVFSDGKKVIGSSKFKATALEDAIKEMVKATTGDADSPMLDALSDRDVCKTYVMVTLIVALRN